MMPVICPACLTLIGYGTEETAPMYAASHTPLCTATDDEREAAAMNMRFKTIISGLNL